MTLQSSFGNAAYNRCRITRNEQKRERLVGCYGVSGRKKAPLPSLTEFQMSSLTPTRTSQDLYVLQVLSSVAQFVPLARLRDLVLSSVQALPLIT